MCNDYEQHVLWAEYCKMMLALELGIPTHQSELDLPQADDIKINDMGPVMRAAGNGIELVAMNFSFPPSGPRGGPVFNFRSEGRSFANSNRCIIRAEGITDHSDRRHLARWSGQSAAGVHHADDRARPRRCPLSQSPGRGASAG
jgi:hypothetical protein